MLRLGLLLLCVLQLASLVVSQAPSKPVWPVAFSSKFGLYQFDGLVSNNPIFNETSMFYYAYEPLGAQLIDYPTRCVPILFPDGDDTPCSILFNSQGIYISQPKRGIDCCTLINGVGPSPPNFLEGFTWNGTATAPDYTGDIHDVNFWISADGTFKYWTDLYSHHDIFFRDGGGAFWTWDHFNLSQPDPSLFNLPASPSVCSQACPGAATQVAKKHPMIKLALDAANVDSDF